MVNERGSAPLDPRDPGGGRALSESSGRDLAPVKIPIWGRDAGPPSPTVTGSSGGQEGGPAAWAPRPRHRVPQGPRTASGRPDWDREPPPAWVATTRHAKTPPPTKTSIDTCGRCGKTRWAHSALLGSAEACDFLEKDALRRKGTGGPPPEGLHPGNPRCGKRGYYTRDNHWVNLQENEEVPRGYMLVTDGPVPEGTLNPGMGGHGGGSFLPGPHGPEGQGAPGTAAGGPGAARGEVSRTGGPGVPTGGGTWPDAASSSWGAGPAPGPGPDNGRRGPARGVASLETTDGAAGGAAGPCDLTVAWLLYVWI